MDSFHRSAILNLIGLLWLAVLLSGCGGDESTSAAPEQAVEQAPAPSPTSTPALPFPRFFGPGEAVSSHQAQDFDLQLRGVEYRGPAQLVVHLGLYNNNDEQELSFDPTQIVEGLRLTNGEESVPPSSTGVEQGNSERLIPRSGLLIHATFTPPAGERLELQVPGFPDQTIDLSEPALPEPATPSPPASGLWRAGEPIVASYDFPGIGMHVIDMRVRASEMIVHVGFINLREEVVSGGESTLTGYRAVLVDGQGLAFTPTEVEGTLAESILPQGEWYPGELHEGLIHFPLPTATPLRFEFPSFPPLSLTPAQRPAVALATEANYPPAANSPVTLTPPPPLPDITLIEPIQFDEVEGLLARINQSFMEKDQERFLSHFAGEAHAQMASWWPGIASTPIRESSFRLRDTGDARGPMVSAASFLFFYALEGDSTENRFMLPVTLDLQREGDRWQVTRWESDTPIWAQEWQVAETPHFLLLTDPAVAAEADLLSAEAEVAYEEIVGRLTSLAPRDRYVMLVPASPERFSELTERGHETQGVASSRYLIRGSTIETNSLSFVLNGASLTHLPHEERHRTITHELVHLLLAPVTRSYTPAWVAEGTATYFSEGVPWATIREWIADHGQDAISLTSLTSLDQFTDWSEPRTVPLQYAYSAAVIGYLVETYGQEAFLAFYEDFASNANSEALREVLNSTNSEERLVELRLQVTNELLQQHFEQDLTGLEVTFEEWVLREAATQ